MYLEYKQEPKTIKTTKNLHSDICRFLCRRRNSGKHSKHQDNGKHGKTFPRSSWKPTHGENSKEKSFSFSTGKMNPIWLTKSTHNFTPFYRQFIQVFRINLWNDSNFTWNMNINFNFHWGLGFIFVMLLYFYDNNLRWMV